MSVFNNYKNEKEEQKTFLSLLYHDTRNGQFIRLEKKGEEVRQYSTCEQQELAYTGTDANVYVTVNSFRGYRRTADKLYNKTAMFIDLDSHRYSSKEELNRTKNNTRKVLEAAFKNGDLAVPTMITSTGRGYGLFYVLKSSIANTDRAAKSMQLFNSIYDQLIVRIKEILESVPDTMEVDTKVRDSARVVRMPGTVNQNNGAVCHLVSVNSDQEGNPVYYDLQDIMAGCKLYNHKKQDNKPREEKKIINFVNYLNPFLAVRVKRLQKLQEIRGVACVDSCRETMCFILYSALTQISSHDDAVRSLYEYNAAFTEPLPEEELEHIIVETDAHVVPDGPYKGAKGYYPYSDLAIIRTLDITDAEIKEIGFGSSWERQLRKEENQRKKKERNDAIATAIVAEPERIYADIAKEYKVSVRTVERIAKAYNVHRYNVAVTEEDTEQDEEKILLYTGSDQGTASKTSETDKNCSESGGVCADRGFALSSLLSALYERWPATAQLMNRVLQEAADIAVSDREFGVAYARVQASVLVDPAHLIADSLDIARKIALLITDYKASQVSVEPALAKKKLVRKKSTIPDVRFTIIEKTEEYKRRLDQEIYGMIKKAFQSIMSIKKENWMINNRSVSMADIHHCFAVLTYKDIVVITERIAHQLKGQKPSVPLYYVITAVWCYKHPEDACHLVKNAGEKPKNKFCNFKGRDYTSDDITKLELALIAKDW